jgi:hypothetical protein
VTAEELYILQNLPSSFRWKQGCHSTCYVKTNCSHCVKFDIRYNKRVISVKTLYLGNVSESEKSLRLLLKMVYATASFKYCNRTLNHPVYWPSGSLNCSTMIVMDSLVDADGI